MEVATGALGTLIPKLGQLLQDEYNLQKGVKKDIEFLSRELESMRAGLRSVGELPREEIKEQVRIWARDVRELSYDMEDIVDTFLVRVQGPEAPSKRSTKRFMKKMMDIVTKATIRHEIGQEIKDIKERVKEVAERRDRYKVDAITPAKTFVDPRITSLYTKTADLVAIDETREELITRLIKGDGISTQQRTISVVGFGGLGKTTLAKAAYDKLKGQFDCIAFVPVGRNPDFKKVFKDISIDLHMHFNVETLDERQLIDKLREFLDNKRYLIVIDDVWETQSWGIIKLALVENNNGSRVIITTRTHEVAKEAGEVYELQPLSNENSRKLFFARIFGGESKISDPQPDDDEVLDKILRKCDGIPLALITMASLLVGKPREEWSEVYRSMGLGNNKKNQQVENTMKILSFSYYDLPSHLRTCLLYLSVFLEDYFIQRRPLIWMWIAEGFIHEKQGMSLFEIGEGYFNELINRSMIQLVEKEDWDGMMVCGCQVHDMVLDIIRSISSEENFVTILDSKKIASLQGKVRRLAVQNNSTVETHIDMKRVRSFIPFGHDDIDKHWVPVSSFMFVRVLHLHISSKCCHLKHLRMLLHLRYLRLIFSGIDELPEEVGTLKLLQTLNVEGMEMRKMANFSVGLLRQLLCLRFRDTVDTVPAGLGELMFMEQLEIDYDEHEKAEPSIRQFVKDLGSLRELRVLRVGVPPRLSSDVRVQVDMVKSLRNLKKLNLLSLWNTFSPAPADTAVWEAAGFLLPRCLRQLLLGQWVIFSRFPSFCINPSRLPNLSNLYLAVDVLDDQDLRILGGLPELCSLKLDVMSTAQVVVCNPPPTDGDGDGHLFQKLRRCRLWYDHIRLLPSKDASFLIQYVSASMLLGSEKRKDDVGVAPTLLPFVHELLFNVYVGEFKYGNDDGRFSLEYFASLQNVRAHIHCDGASASEVEEVEGEEARGETYDLSCTGP